MNLPSKKALFFALILVVLAIVGFLVVRKLNQGKIEPILGVQPFWANQEVNQGQPVDEETYRQSLKQVVASLKADPKNPAVIKSGYEKILALAVPNQYRQLHLAMVLALADLEKPDSAQKGQAELDQILADNDWLGGQ